MTFLFFLFAFLSETIGTMAGFGSSTILLPIAVLIFDFQTALILVAFFHLAGNCMRFLFFRSGFDKPLAIRFGVPSVLFALIGALFVSYIPQTVLRGLLGFLLVFYSIQSLLRYQFILKQRDIILLFGGGLSGFLAGLVGTGGAIRSAFLTTIVTKKRTYIATMAAIEIAVDLTRIPVYVKEGFLDASYDTYIPVLFLLAILGSFVGKNIISRVPEQKYKRFVFLAILLVGLKFIVDWL